MKEPIEIFLDLPQKKLTTGKLRPSQKFLTHAKNVDPRKKTDPRKNIFDPRNPRKNYGPRNMSTHVINILTHVRV